jgi:hypothetical protein
LLKLLADRDQPFGNLCGVYGRIPINGVDLSVPFKDVVNAPDLKDHLAVVSARFVVRCVAKDATPVSSVTALIWIAAELFTHAFVDRL